MKVSEMLNLSFSHYCFLYGIVARDGHTSVVLSDGSVLVMGGSDIYGIRKNDVWKTMNAGASWILVTSSAGWTGKKSIQLMYIASYPILSFIEGRYFSISRPPPYLHHHRLPSITIM